MADGCCRLKGDDMSFEKSGRYWPNEADRQPLVSRFWVPRSSLFADEKDYIAGTVDITIVERTEDVEDRLKDSFPAYKLAAWGKKVLKIGEWG